MQSTWHGHYVTSRHRLSKLFCLDEERESLNPVVNILPQVPYNSLPLPLSTKVSWEGLGRAEAKSSGADAIGRLPPMPLVCSETSPPPPRTQQALRVLPTGSNMSAGFYDEIRAASGAFKFFVRAPPIGFPEPMNLSTGLSSRNETDGTSPLGGTLNCHRWTRWVRGCYSRQLYFRDGGERGKV